MGKNDKHLGKNASSSILLREPETREDKVFNLSNWTNLPGIPFIHNSSKVAFSSHENKRPTIGIRLPPWAANTLPVLGGVVDYMRTHGLWRIETPFDSFGEMEKVELTKGWQGDGLILFRATGEELQDFKNRGIAVVLLSSEGPDLGFPRVLPNNEMIGREAAGHLLGLGLQSFAYLARGDTLYQNEQYASGRRIYSRERLAGYKEALLTAGHEPLVHLLPGLPLWKKDTWRKIEEIVLGFLLQLPPSTGLFTADDALGAVVLRVAAREGLRVPQQLSVIGFGDDLNYCHSTLPALSSIAYPARQIGRLAAAGIAAQFRGGGETAKSIIIPPGPVYQRESSDFVAIDDPETANLVHWIRKVAPVRAIQVSDVTERSSHSASTVKSKFRHYLGHGPKREIIVTRVAHLHFLLRDHEIPLTKIAEIMQFASTHELSRFLVRETGERPTAYRELFRRT